MFPTSVMNLLLTFYWTRYHRHRDGLLLLYRSAPQVQHPPVCPSLTYRLTFSACLLTPLVLWNRFRVYQSPHGLAAG
jgi:hypothetical protein